MLDLEKLAPRMHQLVEDRAQQLQRVGEHAGEAHSRLRQAAGAWDDLQRRVARSRTSWLVADLLSDPSATFCAPPCPAAYAVVATDGSQIAADRHEASYCAVLNVGKVLIRYGDASAARLQSVPELVFEEEDIENEIGRGRLEHKRAAVEHDALAELVTECAELAAPTVAMVDGTLILWSLDGEEDDYRKAMVERFTGLLDVARERRAPVVGFISRPGSRDVVNALRVHACPFDADCEKHCSEQKGRFRHRAPCAGVEMATDGLLFGRMLAPGERSALFGTRSKIMGEYPPEHVIRFCYVHAGSEVVRLEVPRWVAEDAALMDLAHAACLDQVAKGQGYPRALTEAHELAVVRGPDRARFYEALEGMMVRANLRIEVTRKALSKRTRSI